jgi:hypothetical protein
MARFNPIQNSFNGGELSPWLAGRSDVAKYQAGCRRMENFLPMVEGPAFARPGTPFVAEVKDSNDRTWLVRFEFSETDAYILEFGDLYIRFYYGRAQVIDGGPPYEIVSPYSAADLTNSDGTFALNFAQSGDVIRIVGGGKFPQKLSRLAATNWTIAPIDFIPPAFEAENDTATTVYASAISGTGITLTASSAIFTAARVGQYIRLQEKDVRDTQQWEAGKSISTNDLRRSDGNNYKALNTATTGSYKPTHNTGAAYDGDNGVQWQYMDSGYGYAKITAVGGTTATADVISQLPDGAVTSGNATERWAFSAWTADAGYPTAVTFFRERLVLARDSTLWFSVSGDFDNFATEIDGQITADAGFERTLSSDRVNSIRWLSPGDVLLVGTVGDEWAVVEATTTDPFGPDNCKAKRQSTYGSSQVSPVRIGSETLFVQKAGRKVRAMPFEYSDQGTQSPNVADFARHITKGGIVSMAYQQEPWSILWAARGDGVLIGMTFDRTQDVVAWHRHPFSGGIVECVETIPSPNGGRDDLWMIVRYTIDGSTKRYIAYLAEEAEDDTDQEDWAYSDMMLTYDGAAATTISGLGHLEGKEVWILADGARHPNRTVTAGEIELQRAASKVQIGLPSEGLIEPMDIDGGASAGTSQGKIKRCHLMTLRVYNSLGGTAGPTEDSLTEIRYRLPSVPMGSAPPPFTGDVEIEWPGDYSTSLRPVIKKDRPMPFTLIATMPQVVVTDGR